MILVASHRGDNQSCNDRSVHLTEDTKPGRDVNVDSRKKKKKPQRVVYDYLVLWFTFSKTSLCLNRRQNWWGTVSDEKFVLWTRPTHPQLLFTKHRFWVGMTDTVSQPKTPVHLRLSSTRNGVETWFLLYLNTSYFYKESTPLLRIGPKVLYLLKILKVP